MRTKSKMENRPAQRDSEISILKTSPTGLLAVRLVPQSGDPYRPFDFKTTPAQRHSKMSNCEVGILRILRILGILGWKTKSKNSPAQRHSKMSNWVTGRTSQTNPTSPTDAQYASAQLDSGIYNLARPVKTAPAQRHSKMSNLKTSPYRPYSPYRPLDFKTTPAQQHSKMFNSLALDLKY